MPLADTVGELLIKVKPDGSTFDKDLEGIVGPAASRALGGVQTSSRLALGAVTAVGTGLFALGVQLDDAYDTIRIGSGATGEALLALQGSFDAIAQNVPNDLGEVALAVTDLNQRLGITGPELDKLAEQFLQLTNITGESLPGAIDAATGVFNQFNIPVDEQAALLDNLFQSSQASGLSVTELSAALVKSGAVFDQFGLSVEESADLIALLAKNGITAKETGTALTKVLQIAADAGVPAADAFSFIEQSIKGAATETDALSIALDAFGPKAGPKLAGQIRDGTLSLTDFEAALAASDDTIIGVAEETADAAESFKKLKNQLAITLGPAANNLFNSFGEAAANAAPAIVLIVEALAPFLIAITSLPSPVLAAVVGLLVVGATLSKTIGPIMAVGKAFTGLTTILAANPFILVIAAAIALAILIVLKWDEIKAAVGAALTFLGGLFDAYLPVFQSAFDTTFGAIGGAVDAVGGAFSAVGGTIASVWQTIVDATSTAVTTMVDQLKKLGRAADSALGPLDEILGGAARGLGSVFGGFRATGGGVRAGMSYVVGERGPEVFTASRSGAILPNMAFAGAGGGAGSGVTVQGPLLYVGSVTVANEQDITTMSRRLAEETGRVLRAAGDR